MKIAIVTDAWHPQVNGVVRTLDKMVQHLRAAGHELLVISPDQFRSVAAPGYPEIRLAFTRSGTVGKKIAAFGADSIHLVTEGPLCMAARRWCLSNNLAFTTAYHTHFPDYLARRTGLSARIFWPYIRWFHGPSRAIMASTSTLREQLCAEGLPQVHHWSRGVDMSCFTPDAPPPALFAHLPRPIQLYVGRVAVEKNIEAFLETDHPGSKVVVGDGPALAELQRTYPNAHFLGRQTGTALAGCYAGADIFVFPSRTDTFGLVMIEALACGTPVAAYPVPGPVDVLTARSGAMDERLDQAIAAGLQLSQADCVAAAGHFQWSASASQFLDGLVPAEFEQPYHLSRRFLYKAMLARSG